MAKFFVEKVCQKGVWKITKPHTKPKIFIFFREGPEPYEKKAFISLENGPGSSPVKKNKQLKN